MFYASLSTVMVWARFCFWRSVVIHLFLICKWQQCLEPWKHVQFYSKSAEVQEYSDWNVNPHKDGRVILCFYHAKHRNVPNLHQMPFSPFRADCINSPNICIEIILFCIGMWRCGRLILVSITPAFYSVLHELILREINLHLHGYISGLTV